MRSDATRLISFSDLIPTDVNPVPFEPEKDGNWERMPAQVADVLSETSADAIIKFGMGLLRDPDTLPAPLGVLSFHHGDPAGYRGRPAGFYELLHGETTVGAMVQRIGNKLDAGSVLAFGRSRVVPHSYHHTLQRHYWNSSHLLSKALLAARRGEPLAHPTDGPNFRLPPNRTVVRFVVKLLARRFRRLAYGLTRTKRWRVAQAEPLPAVIDHERLRLKAGDAIPLPPNVSFLADPITDAMGRIWCEGLDSGSGLGRIVCIERDGTVSPVQVPGHPPRHIAYPFTIDHDGQTILLPDSSPGTPVQLHYLSGTAVVRSAPLKGLEDRDLVDPTLIHHAGKWWLFAGERPSSLEILWLWYADDIEGPFHPHPMNPIVMDPERARCAGRPFEHDGSLIRPGQSNLDGYGNGVTLCRIEQLTTDRFEETKVAELRVAGFRGPHTLNSLDGHTIIDYYDEPFSLTAWLPRVKARLQSAGS